MRQVAEGMLYCAMLIAGLILSIFCLQVCFHFLFIFPAPSSVELQIDGKNDKCSKGEDINFVFTGFTLTGQVRNGCLLIKNVGGVKM